MSKLYEYLAALIAVAVLVWGAMHWHETLVKEVYADGVAAQRAADAEALVAAERQKQSQESEWRKEHDQDQKDLTDAKKRLDDFVASHPPTHGGLCKPATQGGSAGGVPTTGAARPGEPASGGSVLPGGTVYVPGPDLGPGFAVFERIADKVVESCRTLDKQARRG